MNATARRLILPAHTYSRNAPTGQDQTPKRNCDRGTPAQALLPGRGRRLRRIDEADGLDCHFGHGSDIGRGRSYNYCLLQRSRRRRLGQSCFDRLLHVLAVVVLGSIHADCEHNFDAPRSSQAPTPPCLIFARVVSNIVGFRAVDEADNRDAHYFACGGVVTRTFNV